MTHIFAPSPSYAPGNVQRMLMAPHPSSGAFGYAAPPSAPPPAIQHASNTPGPHVPYSSGVTHRPQVSGVKQIKTKSAPKNVRATLSGGHGVVDTAHGSGTVESKRKVQQAQRFNLRQQPSGGGPTPTPWHIAEQPVSGF